MPSNNSDFSTTPYTHRSMRHFTFPRRAPSHGLGHNTLIIIVVSVSVVGGLLLTFFIWRIISRLLRPKSAPLPRRQSLVHQRELQLVAFNEYKDAIVPQIFTNDSGIHGSDETTLDSPYGIQLHPPSPQFFPPPTPPMGSVSSLLSSNDDSSPSSSVATPHTQFSTSAPANQSSRRGTNHSGPRPLSTFSTSSRQSVRGAPHAPHNNVQIILPAPLAPNLYQGTASDGSLFPFPRALTRDSTYSVRDSWRRSLADSWILVGQDSLADSELMEQQYGHDSMKRPSRLIRRGSSPGPLPPRSRSTPTLPSRLRLSSGSSDQHPEGTHPPVPRVPFGFVRVSGDRSLSPSTSSWKGGSFTPAPSSTDSHKPRS